MLMKCYAVSVQMGNIIGNNVFRADDAPLYKRGYSILLGLNLLGIAMFVANKVYYIRRNEQREVIWRALSEEVCVLLFIPKEKGLGLTEFYRNEKSISRTAQTQEASV